VAQLPKNEAEAKAKLGTFGLQHLRHLRKNLPAEYRTLLAAGTLHRSAYRAQEQAKDQMESLMSQGYPYLMALEVVNQTLLPRQESTQEEEGDLAEIT